MNKLIGKITAGVKGDLKIPGDKSISHRAVMLATLGKTPVKIENFLHAADTLSTVKIMQELGAKIDFVSKDTVIVTGVGLGGLKEPTKALDAGNSGTTLRLLMGLTAGANINAMFTGDDSLSKRPMKRIIDPLSQMGAKIESNDGKLPIKVIKQGKKLSGITYKMPMASAQLKSALLFAGLFAEGKTSVIEPNVSRDHTERMLSAFGANIKREGNMTTIEKTDELIAPENIFVPSDISSAAYFLAAALIVPNSDLTLKNIGINPTRTGIIDVLEKMGANIELKNKRVICGEEIADIRAVYGKLHGCEIKEEIMGRLIDEVPIIAVLAAFAQGKTVISGAKELRVKETDRIKAVAKSFNQISNGMIIEKEDGMIINGGLEKKFAEADSFKDHRIAMSLAILGAAGEGVNIKNAEAVDISYQTFYEDLSKFA